ncbi:SURF1 family protein [Stagnihabitans tardus]|uniref:SURF1-like protein n=1 Tax=Stagnihabitans tardus TaxID=2699202 RepID=A0AAE4YAA0_9RHOB|nr:SURF1 family cytochrome oxidase biogenesis protein [Stagnihabitans tardus]NBZ87746.1 SURF1 family protein [Stagnihabitans tardus]
MRRFLVVLSVLGVALFLALGVWQVQRLAWKTALIAEVDMRLASAAVPATEAGAPEYTRLTVKGRYLARQILVKAVTEEGQGDWVMTPLTTDQGWTLWVNRGFLPDGETLPPPPAQAEVTGLARDSQPGGGFLRANDPTADRWFSRDVAAMSAASGVQAVGWFLDAETGGPLPVPGLTVVEFRNSHLIYAVTWFALALLLAGGAWWNLGPRAETD